MFGSFPLLGPIRMTLCICVYWGGFVWVMWVWIVLGLDASKLKLKREILCFLCVNNGSAVGDVPSWKLLDSLISPG